MLEIQTREFTARDGSAVAFSVSHLPGTKGLAMLLDLARMFGPALGILVDAAGGVDAKASLSSLVSQKTEGDVFGRVAMSLVTQLESAKVYSMVNQLKEVTKVQQDGGEIPLPKIYELRFQGDQLLQLKWLAFALEVQFGDFLSLRDVLGRAASVGASNAPQT